jgi:predicted nucleic acid-binding Zn ribbon protein
MRGFEARLRQLERGGVCPECAEARAALLQSIVAPEPGDAPTRCEGCGRDVRLSLAEVDAILEGEGVHSYWPDAPQ